VKKSLFKSGFEPVANQTPEQFAQFVKKEVERWSKVIKANNIQAN
jgi:tripartite-type tricarboxylate transporter receptor subunit TctC